MKYLDFSKELTAAVGAMIDEKIKIALHNVEAAPNFDMFRLSKSKKIVDISPNTLRTYEKLGLRIYKHGKAVYVSKVELQEFIKRRAT